MPVKGRVGVRVPDSANSFFFFFENSSGVRISYTKLHTCPLDRTTTEPTSVTCFLSSTSRSIGFLTYVLLVIHLPTCWLGFSLSSFTHTIIARFYCWTYIDWLNAPTYVRLSLSLQIELFWCYDSDQADTVAFGSRTPIVLVQDVFILQLLSTYKRNQRSHKIIKSMPNLRLHILLGFQNQRSSAGDRENHIVNVISAKSAGDGAATARCLHTATHRRFLSA